MSEACSNLPSSIEELIHCAALRWPRNIAISSQHACITYQQLAQRAQAIKDALHAKMIGPGARVALYASRCTDAVVTMLGIMCSGAAVVMLPHEQSPALLLNALETAEAHLLITLNENAIEGYEGDWLNALEVIRVTNNVNLQLSQLILPADAAYMVFTSGSSGKPKAVVVSHANIIHYCSGIISKLNMPAGSALRFGHVTTLAADLGYTAIFPTLLAGGQICMPDNDAIKDPQLFWQAVSALNINYLKTTPSHFRALMEGRPENAHLFDTVILGGEKLQLELAHGILAKKLSSRLVNHYGPTETTIGAACYILHSIDDIPAGSDSVPIGTAIGNSSFSLSDDNNEMGELVISGDGVSLGYYGHDHSFKNFINLGSSAQAYKTGDICRKLQHGNLEFIGRNDRRTKIRGYLADPVAIEAAIEENKAIIKAAVITVDVNEDQRLAAVIFTRPGHETTLIAGIKQQLLQKFPTYLQPSWIFQLDKLLLTSNGKLDYGAVTNFINEAIQKTPANQHQSHIHSQVAASMAQVWGSYIGIGDLPASASFFETGGDSILIMRYVARLRAEGLNVSLQDVYDNPTPHQLAEALEQKSAQPSSDDKPGTSKKILTPLQHWFFNEPMDDHNHWNQAVLLASGTAIDILSLQKAVQNVIVRNPILSQTFQAHEPCDVCEASAHLAFGLTYLQNSHEAEHIISITSAALHKNINLQLGQLFKVHLFKSVDGWSDRILLIAHHLVIDGISWRILLDDIANCYAAACNNRQLPTKIANSFWEWTALNATKKQAQVTPAKKFLLPMPVLNRQAVNQHASCILSLGESETKAMLALCNGLEHVEAILLQAFADGAGNRYSVNTLTIDVEKHGRANMRGAEDFLSALGWFTTVSAVNVDAGPAISFAERARQTMILCRNAPQTQLPYEPSGICFNFLGIFYSPVSSGVNWRPAHEYIGPCRCANGESAYALRFTARIAENRLIIDIVYNTQQVSQDDACYIADAVVLSLNAFLQPCSVTCHPVVTQIPYSTTGMLMLLPHTNEQPATVGSERKTVLLTGATGFLGINLLQTLVTSNRFHVNCLVRAESNEAAHYRLSSACAAYFGRKQAEDIFNHVTVYAGDVTKPQLALEQNALQHVTEVFHAAALTRLLGPYNEHKKVNVDSLYNLLAWMQNNNNPDLHYISTLAVSGKNPAQSCCDFTEDDFDIGQEFLTPYEQSKFEAEKIVRSTMALRRRTHIYRMGHVAAHSVTGAFQKNVGDNRIYQVAKGYIMLGMAPRLLGNAIAFSHVDVIAKAITAIALSQLPTGTYHVENPHAMTHSQLVSAIAACNYPVNVVPLPEFLERMEQAAEAGNRMAMLALVWMRRESRNVTYRQDKTIKLLAELGVHFPRPTVDWFKRAMSFAVKEGFLPAPGEIKPSPPLINQKT